MPPTAALQEASQDTRQPPRATCCTQCGERVEKIERLAREKALCDDCAFDNVPFTD